MNLFEIRKQDMGGNAVPGVGALHKSELSPTLRSLEKKLGLSENFLDNRLLGSVGKKTYSGDIDIVMDPIISEEVVEFFRDLKILYGVDSVRKNGNIINVAVPIEQFNESYHDRLPRTGKVQVDFIFAEPEFTKLFHFSPGDESAYKGVHRNIALSSIASLTEVFVSENLDDQGRHVEKIRWKWSPQGCFKIKRSSKLSEDGRWLKTQKDEIIGEVLKDPQQIVEKFFGTDAAINDLDSFETIIEAVKKYFSESKQDEVFKRIAWNLEDYNKRSTKTDLSRYGVPPEIEPFMSKNDK
jgi:hypothetical protein